MRQHKSRLDKTIHIEHATVCCDDQFILVIFCQSINRNDPTTDCTVQAIVSGISLAVIYNRIQISAKKQMINCEKFNVKVNRAETKGTDEKRHRVNSCNINKQASQCRMLL